jgi:hypothetical protein
VCAALGVEPSSYAQYCHITHIVTHHNITKATYCHRSADDNKAAVVQPEADIKVLMCSLMSLLFSRLQAGQRMQLVQQGLVKHAPHPILNECTLLSTLDASCSFCMPVSQPDGRMIVPAQQPYASWHAWIRTAQEPTVQDHGL